MFFSLYLLVTFVSSSSALTFLTPTVQQVHAPKWIRSWPDVSVYSRNYSLKLDPTSFLCKGQTVSTPALANAFILGIYSKCQGATNAAVNGWYNSGASGILYAIPAFCADLYAGFQYYSPPLNNPLRTAPGGEPFPNDYNTDFPVSFFRYTGHEDQYTSPTNIEYWPTVVGQLKSGANVTFFYDAPPWNSLVDGYNQPPNFMAAVMYTGQVVFTAIFVLVGAKLAVFVFMEGKIQPSLPQMTLACVFLSAFWAWIFFHWGPLGTRGYMDHRWGVILLTWSFPPNLWGCVLLAFYLSEVASLTSSSFSIGLQKFKIPALIVCVVIYVADLICSCITGSRVDTVDITTLFRAWAAVELACNTLVGALVIWGIVSLGRSVSGLTDERKSMIVRTIVMCIILLVFELLGAGLFWGVLLTAISIGNNITMALLFLSLLLYTGGVNVMLALLYRPRVSKEIEISKSATSSTSSSFSSSSSSSSVSSQDPVIEL